MTVPTRASQADESGHDNFALYWNYLKWRLNKASDVLRSHWRCRTAGAASAQVKPRARLKCFQCEKYVLHVVIMKRALLVGINYGGTRAELRGCHNDIDLVKGALEAASYAEVVILRDNAPTATAEEPFPTRANILAAMKDMVAKTGPGDLLLLHYSGHGASLPDECGGQKTAECGASGGQEEPHSGGCGLDEPDGRDEAICPADYEFEGVITDDELRALLVDALNPHARLRVIFDCCHSGSALDLPYVWTEREKTTREGAHTDKDVIMLSGCADSEYSIDAVIAGKRNGALTAAVCAALNAPARPPKRSILPWVDSSGAQPVRWKDLTKAVRKRIRKYKQNAQLSFSDPASLKAPVDIF